MHALILITVITCNQAFDIVNKISSALGLNYQQKLEVISEIKKVVPSCPFTIKTNEPPKK